MICDEIYEAINDPDDDGTRVNYIADEFRGERDAIEILELLNSSDSELISIGAWILDEICFDKYKKKGEIIFRLVDLCSHEDSNVRYSVLGALYAVFEVDKQFARKILGKMRLDVDEGVRNSVQLITEKLSLYKE
ncbi:MAG: hypothetical protein G3M70_08655 [Candidatus Nitronauta litoralis]|uniref:HEAT repeat domain-containing protein n=1 Tax=Candidatus Nitronauta litoralis TaxID=2705533 RepID=A0A7T0G025_9BACT|nr:MAG: hypothetical protein G3M70_08655 [Candidatus Nitronauta litoralis]